MINVIKSVADLPEWFREKKYRKALGAADWYREIRVRTHFATISAHRFGEGSPKRPDGAEHWERWAKLLEWEAHPSAPHFHIQQDNDPVADLTVAEALFLSESHTDPSTVATKGRLSNLIAEWEKEQAREDSFLYSYQYEIALRDFVIEDMDKEEIWNAPAYKEIGNPFFNYGRRPLSGWPVCIDTQYDDETILSSLRAWLINRRLQEGEKARRPFNERDFSDWENYRIREIYDLDLWARLHDVKILDRVLAAALWPSAPDTFSPLDVLRTTARKKVVEMFQPEVAVRMYGQLRLQLGENFLGG